MALIEIYPLLPFTSFTPFYFVKKELHIHTATNVDSLAGNVR